ncbi:unnamed protein product [Rotaria sp. Silwood1]|nr:unnamed protein product [Rotaria sp. Silwood1]CAF0998534.1 unnamed protein product [Rotaria sp. Silwood1]CAF3385530.1 unnamed protein product [Rotaria sp. Silwood1]CAF3407474.1 unnamed protein product [Rotaria sp. Silwood1]CAF3420093.1 unnamed protein product [Rotaria sp. Silwood1]
MYSIWLLILLIGSLIQIIYTTNLRCNEDINGTVQLIENCRACVIFIDTKNNTKISSKKMLVHNKPSIKELFFYDDKKRYRRYSNTIIHQKCAHESDGPLYGYDQTYCYCNSNQCNLNVQRCIYEIVSKRYFSCYHGSNTSYYSLEIIKQCRSCRIRIETDLTYYYECLTFGEQEQTNNTHCTCQHPMCNQDFAICQRFQQIPSQPRVNLIHASILNSTKSTSTNTIMTITTTITTTITSMIINLTKNLMILSSSNETEEEILIENSTLIELTSASYNETLEIKTTILEIKNHANYNSSNFLMYFNQFLLVCFLFLF